jgi:phosphatidylserine/phosphatidylglycerophosphate/cardiolipin synthase-like enzyme
MSAAVADQLVAEATLSRASRFSLLTWLTEAATGSGFLDPIAVRALLNGGWDVRSLKRLHAKVVLVDGSFGLVGSGNFTSAGMLGGNVELGVVLSAAQRRHADTVVGRWWAAAAAVTPRILEPFLRTVPKAGARRAVREFGGTYPVPVPPRVRAQNQNWIRQLAEDDVRDGRTRQRRLLENAHMDR